jgi:hypothetical protein
MMDATSICNIMLPHTGPHYVTPPLVMLNSAKMHESLLSRDAFNLSSTPVVDIKSDRRKEHTDIADIKSWCPFMNLFDHSLSCFFRLRL